MSSTNLAETRSRRDVDTRYTCEFEERVHDCWRAADRLPEADPRYVELVARKEPGLLRANERDEAGVSRTIDINP